MSGFENTDLEGKYDFYNNQDNPVRSRLSSSQITEILLFSYFFSNLWHNIINYKTAPFGLRKHLTDWTVPNHLLILPETNNKIRCDRIWNEYLEINLYWIKFFTQEIHVTNLNFNMENSDKITFRSKTKMVYRIW